MYPKMSLTSLEVAKGLGGDTLNHLNMSLTSARAAVASADLALSDLAAGLVELLALPPACLPLL